MNVKRGLKSAAKPWTQFTYNITFEINFKIIDDNTHGNYLFFTVYTGVQTVCTRPSKTFEFPNDVDDSAFIIFNRDLALALISYVYW